MTTFSGWNINNNKPLTKKEKRAMEKMWENFKQGTWQQQIPQMQQANAPSTVSKQQYHGKTRYMALHRVSKKVKLLQHENEWLRKDRIRLKKKLKETEELL